MTFSLPRDASAWWAFACASSGGLLLLLDQQPERLPQGLLLLLASACLFLSSDWISSLHGKGIGGEVPRGRLDEAVGLFLAALALTGVAFFLSLQPGEGRRFWLLLLGSTAALTFWMFLLRSELAPDDRRLLALSNLLCTAPALLLGLLAYGERRPEAWAFWALPALYFPVSAIFNISWLQGLYRAKKHLALLSLPLLLLVVQQFSAGADFAALALLAYLAYLLRRMRTRYRNSAEQLPRFSDIRRFGREQAFWNSLVLASWLLNAMIL